MVYTLEDIRNLLAAASADERRQLAEILDVELDGNSEPPKQADALVRQLCWKYQTPLGYLIRDPSFDEMCVDVAKALKLGGLVKEGISCWTLLRRLIENMLQTMWEEMSPEEREDFAKKMLTAEEFKTVFKGGRVDWGKAGVGTLLLGIKHLGGFATYKVALIIANQVARLLLRRGLSLAANAALVRGLSIFLGPVGWLLMAWGVNDLLGTNFKRTIPAVLYIYCIYERLRESAQLPFEA